MTATGGEAATGGGVVDSAWSRLEGYLEAAGCPWAPNGPASDEQLQALAGLTGPLPAGFVASARRHDGAPLAGTVRPLGLRFLPVAAIADLRGRLDAEWDPTLLPIAVEQLPDAEASAASLGRALCLELGSGQVVEVGPDGEAFTWTDDVEDLLVWLAHRVALDRPRLDPDNVLVGLVFGGGDGAGKPWRPAPFDDEPEPDPEGDRAVVRRWRAHVEDGAPGAFKRFREVFRAGSGPLLGRVRGPREASRLDWERLLAWAEERQDAAARVDALYGAVMVGRPAPALRQLEAQLNQTPADPVLRFGRALHHFLTGNPAAAAADASAVLATVDSAAAKLILGLASAGTGDHAAARTSLEAVAHEAWLPGHDLAKAALAG